MKVSFPACLLLCLCLTTATIAQTTPPPADTVIQKACEEAGQTNKTVFIIFHASWCGWCRRMDTLMNGPALKKLFTNNYVIRHIDVLERPEKKALETPGGEALLKKYHGDEQGIPYWLILNARGKLLADSRIKPQGADPDGHYNNSGCPGTKEEINYFIRVLKNTSSLKAPQLATIRQKFSTK